MDTVTSSELMVEAIFAPVEEMALAGFVAGYRGLTRDVYAPGPASVRGVV